MLARSLSGAVVTPSHTTSTIRSVAPLCAGTAPSPAAGSGPPVPHRAMASSLRGWAIPTSQTPPIHGVGASVQ